MSHKVDNSILIPEMGILLREGKDVRFTPTGVSMRPFIEGNRDTVILRQLPSVCVGDIVLAAINDNQFVLHRVIAIDRDTITLQGDGNLSGTEQCRRSNVLGTVVRVIRPNGKTKRLTRGRLWYHLRPLRKLLLKIYRHLCV